VASKLFEVEDSPEGRLLARADSLFGPARVLWWTRRTRGPSDLGALMIAPTETVDESPHDILDEHHPTEKITKNRPKNICVVQEMLRSGQ
jgi:hypothetical protein